MANGKAVLDNLAVKIKYPCLIALQDSSEHQKNENARTHTIIYTYIHTHIRARARTHTHHCEVVNRVLSKSELQ